MKMKDLFSANVIECIQLHIEPISKLAKHEHGRERNERYPEIRYLLNSYSERRLSNSTFLSRDEMNLANYIIEMLILEPEYIPSSIVLHVIRNINSKLELDAATAA